ncbi:LysM peptidoglycan-binding domain-containing protein [Streptomyces rochei]|uniref:LysM peptidoglycan-binding domain-containing protein n=1 Tax=Streptomyces rochei TaxID=1928 RepID=UPI0036B24569
MATGGRTEGGGYLPQRPGGTDNRSAEIKARENAIKRRLEQESSKARSAALKDVRSQAGKAGGTGKTFTKNYTTKSILGENKGFTKSDYGVGNGAAIPYQVGNATAKVSATATKKPKKQPPKKKQQSSGGHKSYKVKRGDTLSGIASRYGMSWKDIWDYNLKNRSASTVRTLKKRGPNLIYRGGTFYIPNR